MNTIWGLKNIMDVDNAFMWTIITVIYSFIFSSIGIFIFTNLFKINVNIKEKIKLCMVDVFVKVMCEILIPFPYFRLTNAIITTILYKVFLKQSYTKCILGELIIFTSFALPETIFAKLYCDKFWWIDSYAQAIYQYEFKFYLLNSIAVIDCIICNYIQRKNCYIKLNNYFMHKHQMKIALIAISVLLATFLNVAILLYEINNVTYLFLILEFAIIMSYVILGVKSIIWQNQIEENDMKIHNLENHNKTLVMINDSLRGFKHDFSNFVQALDGYAVTNNLDGIKEMCQSICKDCRNLNNMSVLDPKLINNSAVYSIISNKYYLAQCDEVSMSIEVMFDLKEIKVSIYELCGILGILLDNAIEAAKECNEKVVNVKFIKDFNTNRKLVIIENSYSKSDIDLEKIFNKGYSTKSDSKEHGLGLWNVRNILKHTDKINLLTTKGKMFCQKLVICD